MLPPVHRGPSTSRSVKRVNTTLERSKRDVRKIAPKILLESRKRNGKRRSEHNQTQYIHRTDAFSTPQAHENKFETVKSMNFTEIRCYGYIFDIVKTKYKSPDKSSFSNQIEIQRGSLRSELLDLTKARYVNE